MALNIQSVTLSFKGLIVSLTDMCMKVLIIGGGDGGIVRELDRYSAVKEVVMCEIDEVR